MAELLVQILELPEREQLAIIQAILDKMDPSKAVIIQHVLDSEKILKDWQESQEPAFTMEDVRKGIDKLRVQR